MFYAYVEAKRTRPDTNETLTKRVESVHPLVNRFVALLDVVDDDGVDRLELERGCILDKRKATSKESPGFTLIDAVVSPSSEPVDVHELPHPDGNLLGPSFPQLEPARLADGWDMPYSSAAYTRLLEIPQ